LTRTITQQGQAAVNKKAAFFPLFSGNLLEQRSAEKIVSVVMPLAAPREHKDRPPDSDQAVRWAAYFRAVDFCRFFGATAFTLVQAEAE
jgi:hypothetical protein